MQCTPIQMAIGAMMHTFTKYKGSDEKLSKTEFLKLLEKELPDFPQVSKKITIYTVYIDEDCSLDFCEFGAVICSFAYASYELLRQISKQQKASSE
uniref:S100/CaBP-9k-type calcium binding subdomain domain-containing protein n=1 Tax=Mola mola TaxID=94237 RepID=A0A3Q3X827_MOLML